MAIVVNGTTLTSLSVNGTTLGKVICNGVTVFISSLTQPTITKGVIGNTSVGWTVTNASSETVTVYTQVGGYSWQNQTNIGAGATTGTFSQTGLSSGTNYTIYAYIEVSGVSTSATTSSSFTTTSPPVYPQLPTIVGVSSTPTRIYWSVRNNDSGTATTVHTYHKTPTNVYSWQYDYNVPSNSTSGQFSQSVAPGVSYELGARVSVSGKTDQESYATYSGTTPNLTTPKLTLTKLSSTSIKATWGSVTYVGSYRVQIRNTAGSYPTDYITTNLNYTFSSLPVGETYEVRLRVYYDGYYSSYTYKTMAL